MGKTDVKVNDLERLGKEELMERIKNGCAKEAKNYRNGLSLWIPLFALNLFYGIANKEWLAILSLPAIAIITSSAEIWWNNRLSKCNDAHELVNRYKKYRTIGKASSALALVLFVLLCCHLLANTDMLQRGTSFYVPVIVVMVAVVCYVLWFLFFQKKTLTDREIERLRKHLL